MSRILLSAAALALTIFCLPDLADAQQAGIGRGVQLQGVQIRGLRRANNRAFVGGYVGSIYGPNTYYSFNRPEAIPYFAKHPPVYYSRDIVKRPYGISPYAAPAGVLPTEMQVAPTSEPVRIVNPYVDQPGPPITPGTLPGAEAPAEMPTDDAPGNELQEPTPADPDNSSDGNAT